MAGIKAAAAEEEEEALGMPPMMRSLALSATGDFLLLVGVLFILLGIASFVTEFLMIKGSGEFCVGAFLVLAALILLLRSREAMPKITLLKKQKERPSESYR